MPSTGELIDIERVTISSEGDRWKSTCKGNSLAVYPTSSPVLEQRWAGRLTDCRKLSDPVCYRPQGGWLMLFRSDMSGMSVLSGLRAAVESFPL